jgi:hypothetical protein
MMLTKSPLAHDLPPISAPREPAAPHLVRHLNQVDLSRRWKLSPRTLERWRWLGQGPRYLKVGGRVVYRIEDIEAYEEQQLHLGDGR